MNKGMRKDSGIIAGIKKTVFPKRGVMRRGIRKVLSGVMALTIMATSIPLTGLTAYAAQIKGFEVSLQWASGSSAENLNWSLPCRLITGITRGQRIQMDFLPVELRFVCRALALRTDLR